MKIARLIIMITMVGFLPYCYAQKSKNPAPLKEANHRNSTTQRLSPKNKPATVPLATLMETELPIQPVRTITIKNNLSDPLPAYKHWSGTYHPDVFEISIGGKIIKPGDSTTIKLAEGELIAVTYYSKFQNGRQTHKKVALEPNNTQTNFDITFDWHNKYRIKLNDAVPKTVTIVK